MRSDGANDARVLPSTPSSLVPSSGPDGVQSYRRPFLPPSLTDRYADIQFLGQGGMGTVYRATDPRLGRQVALKVLKTDDPDVLRRFVAEARAQARIQHEHVCRVYDAGDAEGTPYIAMPLIDGKPLSEIGSRYTLRQKVRLMERIADAVHEAHRLGIIHRDLFAPSESSAAAIQQNPAATDTRWIPSDG